MAVKLSLLWAGNLIRAHPTADGSIRTALFSYASEYTRFYIPECDIEPTDTLSPILLEKMLPTTSGQASTSKRPARCKQQGKCRKYGLPKR
jgi:hypothetical protein